MYLLPAAVTFGVFMLVSVLLMLYFHRAGESEHRTDLSAAPGTTSEIRLTGNDVEHRTGAVIDLGEQPTLSVQDGARDPLLGPAGSARQ